jgi:IS5 family transposase
VVGTASFIGIVDKFCRPWVLILTPGNAADCTVGPACVGLVDGIKELLGDKAYDSNSFRKSLRKHGIKPVIPGRSNRKKRVHHDKQAYKAATSLSVAMIDSRTSEASPGVTKVRSHIGWPPESVTKLLNLKMVN